MTAEQAIDILENEKKCVSSDCDRDCAKCPLVREAKDILAGFDFAIEKVIKKEQARIATCNPDVGFTFCPACKEIISSFAHNYCPHCGQRLKFVR